jgi:hypothetical protein
MPTLPASWNTPTRVAVKNAVVAAVVVGLFLVFIEQKQWTISGLLVPLLGLGSVYLLLAAVPFTLGRALKTFERLPAYVPALLYFGWATVIAWALAGNSLDVLARCVKGLPAYLDAHGFLMVGVVAAGVVAYFIVRKTLIRTEDAFSLSPSASLLLMFGLDSYFYSKARWGADLDFSTAEVYHGATSFIATFVALTVGGFIAARLRAVE